MLFFLSLLTRAWFEVVCDVNRTWFKLIRHVLAFITILWILPLCPRTSRQMLVDVVHYCFGKFFVRTITLNLVHLFHLHIFVSSPCRTIRWAEVDCLSLGYAVVKFDVDPLNDLVLSFSCRPLICNGCSARSLSAYLVFMSVNRLCKHLGSQARRLQTTWCIGMQDDSKVRLLTTIDFHSE